MRRWGGWALIVLGAWMLLRGGGAIFWEPAWEVHYAADAPTGSCTAAGCYAVYRFEVGNTGGRAQPNVAVRFRRPVVEGSVLPLRARTFGVSDRPLHVTDAGDVRTVALGAFERRERVQLTFILRRTASERFPPWREILVSVEPAHGRARTGSPAWIMLLRAYSAVFLR